MSLRWKHQAVFFLASFVWTFSFGQADTMLRGAKPDSNRNNFMQTIRSFAEQEIADNQRSYNEGKVLIQQRRMIENIKVLSEVVKSYLKNALDTTAVVKELENVNRSLDIAKDGVFSNKGIIQTQRNLSVTADIVRELTEIVSKQKLALDKYTSTLIDYKDKLDSLSSDSSLYLFPADSVAAIKYATRLSVINMEVNPVDSSLKIAVADAQELQFKVDIIAYDLRSLSEDVEKLRSGVASGVFEQELPVIWKPAGFKRPFSEIIKLSVAKGMIVLGFYIRENAGLVILFLALVGLAFMFSRSVKKMAAAENVLNADTNGYLVMKYPLLSSVFVVSNVFQFIFLSPPVIFSVCIWAISILCLSVIFREAVSVYWRRRWYMVVLFFLLATAANFLLQASETERWYILFLSGAGVVFVAGILINSRKDELKERGLMYVILFVGLIEAASFVAAILGRFNLSKSLMVAGYTGMAVAILFLWTIRLINEMLGLTYKVYKFPDKKLFYINFDRIGTEVPRFFYLMVVVGWVVIIGRNFYSYKEMVKPLNDFFTRTRSVGAFVFSLNEILTFVFILGLSVVLSRIISFFASSGPSPHGTTKGDRIGIGSWLLLIRIFIICLGLFMAFAATGIPVDRLTIILGALSVGIGLGLQSLVTNLVSGLILAFEKPVNVGDMLEVNGRIAVMKSIGFRSSIARFSDGSHVVIPNGDVLNQHLVNWSMGGHTKKTSLKIGIAYNSDVDKVRALLKEILENTEHIMKSPAPVVNAKNFGTYAIELELSFWVDYISNFDLAKTDLINKINFQFKKEGIVIPTTWQDPNNR